MDTLGETIRAASYLAVAAFVAARGGTPDEADTMWSRLAPDPVPDSPGVALEQLERAWAATRPPTSERITP